MARETLHWDRPFHTIRSGSFQNGDIVWFPEGGLNASYNCVDRWAFRHPDKVCVLRRPPPCLVISLLHPRIVPPAYALRLPDHGTHFPPHTCAGSCAKTRDLHACAITLGVDASYVFAWGYYHSPTFPAAVGSRVARMSSGRHVLTRNRLHG